MAWTQYSRPVAPPSYSTYKPISDEILLLGAKQQYETAEKVGQLVGLAGQSMFGIKTYGKDAEVLAKLNENFQKEISQLSEGSFSDPSNISKINTVIGRYANDPDIANISKRINIYNRETAKEQEAFEKGEYYTSPAKTTIEEYFNSGIYLRNPKSVNYSTGWVSPPTQKWMKEAREAVKKQVLNTKTGVLEEVIDPIEARDYFMQLASSDPRFPKQIDWDFQQATKGIDWQTEGQNYIAEKIEENRAKRNQAILFGDNDGKLLAERELQRLQKMSNPSIIGEELKNQYRNSWLINEMDKVGYSIDQTSFKDYKRDPVYMENLRSANNREEQRIKAYYDEGHDPATGKPIMIGNQSLADIKQARSAKIEKAKSLTQKEKDRKIITDAIIEKGVVTQDQISQLAEKGETVIYNPITKTVNINYGKYWDPETQTFLLPDKQPISNLPVDQFIRNRTGVQIDLSTMGKKSEGSDTMNIWGRDWKMQTVTINNKKVRIVAPQTQEEYNNIPSGVKYYDIDGQTKTKE